MLFCLFVIRITHKWKAHYEVDASPGSRRLFDRVGFHLCTWSGPFDERHKMINPRYIRFYALSVISQADYERVISGKPQDNRSSYEVALRLFDAFLNIINAVVGVGFTDQILLAFRGFLLIEVEANAESVYRYHRAICQMMPDFEFQHCEIYKNKSEEYKDSCKSIYNDLDKSKRLIGFYGGWYIKAGDGRVHFAHLVDVYNAYGEAVANKFHIALRHYAKRYPTATARTKIGAIKKLMSYICADFPNRDAYSLLFDPTEINVYFGYLFNYLYLERLSVDGEISLFCDDWRQLVVIISGFLVEYKLIGEPLYEIYKTTYKRAAGHSRNNSVVNQRYISTLTKIPLHVTTDEAADIIFNKIVDDLDAVVSACETTRKIILDQHYTRTGLARLGNVSDEGMSKDEKKKLENQCATWEKYNYDVVSEKERGKLYGDPANIAERLGLITNSSLQAHLYLLEAELPAITPSWLVKFEVVDKYTHEYGLRPDGSFVVSEKSRRGHEHAQQPIKLTPKAKTLFREIMMLTAQQREHLKSIGDDDWRFLLLSPGKGYSTPQRIKTIQYISTDLYSTSILQAVLKERLGDTDVQNPDGVYQNISLRCVRASAALKVYFDTGSCQAMADALGHTAVIDDLLGRYLPPQLKAFFMNRWIRIFLNALTYEIMKDSPYLFDSVDFRNFDDLEQFLKLHELKPLPEHLFLGRYGAPKDEVIKQFNQAVVPISPALCTLLVTMKKMIDDDRLVGISHVNEVDSWYQTARFLELSTNLHMDGKVLCSSQEAVEMFSGAQYSPTLANKLKSLIRFCN